MASNSEARQTAIRTVTSTTGTYDEDWLALFTARSIPAGTFNERLLASYVEYIANRRLKALGLDPIYDAPKQNPLPWTQHWLSSKGLQVAPQETEVESYIVGGIKQDVEKDQFSKFKL